MGRNRPSDLTDAEWKVMRIVWQLKTCAARDVYEVAGAEYGWAPTTVKTYLSLLVEKGYLSATRVGNSFLYKPKKSVLQSLKRVKRLLRLKPKQVNHSQTCRSSR